MIVVTNETLNDYAVEHPLKYNKNWAKRDFVPKLSKYMSRKNAGIKMISGLRGTGKTVGMLQALSENNAIYICPEKKGEVGLDDVLDVLKKHPQVQNILIDEVTWLKEFLPSQTMRDRYARSIAEEELVRLSENGKNIILSGTESVSLESMKSRGLIHRTSETVHVTRFSYDEFKRLFPNEIKTDNMESYDNYLKKGGIFESYAVNNFDSMDEYIQEAVIDNLYAYLGTKNIGRNDVVMGTYAILFDAVHDMVGDSLLTDPPKDVAMEKLQEFGIMNPTDKLSPVTVKRISDVLESVGVIIKVKNLVPREGKIKEKGLDKDERTYIVNPAISYQFAKLVYGNINDERAILGRLLEASAIVQLYYTKPQQDNLYFHLVETDRTRRELDAVIVPYHNDSPITLVEVKHRYKITEKKLKESNWSITMDETERQIKSQFPDYSIENRYFIYSGPRKVLSIKEADKQKDFIFTGLDTEILQYWDFEKNKETVIKDEKEARVKELAERRIKRETNTCDVNNVKVVDLSPENSTHGDDGDITGGRS